MDEARIDSVGEKTKKQKLGRPALVTRERIIDAGIEITLPKITVKGMAKQLGVSEMSVFRNVGNLENLYLMVAEGICERVQISMPTADNPRVALIDLARDLNEMSIRYPGIAQYLTNPSSKSVTIFRGLEEHHRAFEEAYGWEAGIASVITGTVAQIAFATSNLQPTSMSDMTSYMHFDLAEFPRIAAGQSYIKNHPKQYQSSFDWFMDVTITGLFDICGISESSQ